MIVYKICWMDHGYHQQSYSTIKAVTDHVEYCLKHGLKVDFIGVVDFPMKGVARSRCIFGK